MTVSVFISHNTADKPFVRQLAADLSLAGVNVWLDEDKIQVGDSILGKIQEGIDESDYLILVLSPEAVSSRWVSKELQQAMQREINMDKVTVLPLLKSPCDIPGFLRDKLYLDFTNSTHYSEALKKLKKRLGLAESPKLVEASQVFRLFQMNTCLLPVLKILHKGESNSQGFVNVMDKLVHLNLDILAHYQELMNFLGDKTAKSDLEEFNIAQLIQDTANLSCLVSNEQDKRNLLVEYSSLEEVLVRGNELLLKLALLTVFGNSFQGAIDESCVIIKQIVSRSSVSIRIKSTVKPIDEKILAKLFREPIPKKKNEENISEGFGLLIANQVIQAHEGKLLLASSTSSEFEWLIELPISTFGKIKAG